MSKETNITEEQTAERKPLFQIITARLNAVSPFEFGTLKEILYPTWMLPFTVLFFCIIVWLVRYKYDYNFVHGGYSRDFVISQLNPKTKITPNIVICGGSLNVSDINRSVFEERMNTLSINLCYPMMTIWAAYRQFEKFERFLDSPKILIISFTTGYEGSGIINNDVVHSNMLFLRRWYETKVPQFDSEKLDFATKYMPSKIKLSSLIKPSLRKSLLYWPLTIVYGDYHSSTWKREDFEKIPEPELINLFRAREESFTDIETLTEIESISKSCKSKGIVLVLNETPFCRPFANESNPVDVAAMQRREMWFKRLESIDNIVLVRSDDFYPIQKEIRKSFLYGDGHHMAYPGAVLYTHYLCDKLLGNEKICKHLRMPYRQNNQTDYANLIMQLNLLPQKQTENMKTVTPLDKRIR